MSLDERKTFAVTNEDHEQNTEHIPVVMQRQVFVFRRNRERWIHHCFRTLTQTVDVPVAKALQKTARGLHNEVQRNQDGQKLRSA